MCALPYRRAVYLLNGKALLLAGNAGEGQNGFAGLFGVHIDCLIYIAIGVTGDGDGLFPVLDRRLDGVYDDRGTEHGAADDGTDGSVGALPHLGELGIFDHSLLVGGYSRTLDRNAKPLGGVCRINGDLVLGLVPVEQAKVVVFGLEIYKGEYEGVLNHAPENSGHFIAVHLDERSFHLYFLHFEYSS